MDTAFQHLLKACQGWQVPRFGSGIPKICFPLWAWSSSRGKKKGCQPLFEGVGLEMARHAGYAQNAKSYLDAKHRTLKAVCEVGFRFTPPAPRALWSKHRFSIDEWIFLSLLVKRPHADVLASGARGMGLPRNPVTAISSDVPAPPLP